MLPLQGRNCQRILLNKTPRYHRWSATKLSGMSYKSTQGSNLKLTFEPLFLSSIASRLECSRLN